jgi:hypothetical protein
MLLTAQLTQEHLSTATRYYLAFKNAGSTDSLAALVQDKNVFKLMAKTEALKAAIWGIKLEPVWATPTDVDDPNAIYFRLDLNDAYSKDRWTRMLAPENRNLLSIRCPAGRLPPDSAVKLVMPLTKA